jgi:excisionase family DNA binding protein
LLLDISRQALWKWIKEGKISAVKLPSGRFRIPESEVVKIMQGRRAEWRTSFCSADRSRLGSEYELKSYQYCSYYWCCGTANPIEFLYGLQSSLVTNCSESYSYHESVDKDDIYA